MFLSFQTHFEMQFTFYLRYLNLHKIYIASPQIILIVTFHQWRIQDFPDGGRQTSRMGANLWFGQFLPKLHKNKEICAKGEGRVPVYLLDPPMLFELCVFNKWDCFGENVLTRKAFLTAPKLLSMRSFLVLCLRFSPKIQCPSTNFKNLSTVWRMCIQRVPWPHPSPSSDVFLDDYVLQHWGRICTGILVRTPSLRLLHRYTWTSKLMGINYRRT